jgi:hypothetical protein
MEYRCIFIIMLQTYSFRNVYRVSESVIVISKLNEVIELLGKLIGWSFSRKKVVQGSQRVTYKRYSCSFHGSIFLRYLDLDLDLYTIIPVATSYCMYKPIRESITGLIKSFVMISLCPIIISSPCFSIRESISHYRYDVAVAKFSIFLRYLDLDLDLYTIIPVAMYKAIRESITGLIKSFMIEIR